MDKMINHSQNLETLRSTRISLISVGLTLLVWLAFTTQTSAHPFVQTEPDAPEEKTPAGEKDKTDDGEVTDTATLKKEEAPLGNQFIRFHMWDGSIVGGDVKTETIEVKTEFGSLQVPISKIVQFYPGLDSLTELNEKVETLVKGLGDRSFDVRESSQRELLSMGLQIKNILSEFDDEGSAERKKRLGVIRKAVEELMADLEEAGETPEKRILIRGDKVVTKDFSIVGKIMEPDFKMASRFGELSVNLNDIQMADRSFRESQPEMRKSVSIDASAFFQTKPVSTRIKVNRGDKITIRASGIVQWTNWSNASGPDGISNQGQWQGMNCGTLAAKIGNGSEYIKVGSNGSFTAKQSGVLYLGIAMRDNYASNNGYRWEGKYESKIVVEPKQD